jgi:hypothetical protein
MRRKERGYNMLDIRKDQLLGLEFLKGFARWENGQEKEASEYPCDMKGEIRWVIGFDEGSEDDIILLTGIGEFTHRDLRNLITDKDILINGSYKIGLFGEKIGVFQNDLHSEIKQKLDGIRLDFEQEERDKCHKLVSAIADVDSFIYSNTIEFNDYRLYNIDSEGNAKVKVDAIIVNNWEHFSIRPGCPADPSKDAEGCTP